MKTPEDSKRPADREGRPDPDRRVEGEDDSPFSRELLQRVGAREPAALGEFFELTFDTVYGLANRLLGDRAAAEDLTQEVFLRVHRSAERLDPDRDPLPWLRTITANLCRDHWRSFGAKLSARTVSIDQTPGLDQKLSNGRRSPEGEALSAERERLVQEAIGRLPESLREVVVLRDYENLDHEEVARIVGASGAAVRKRYSRALAKLGEILKEVLS
jgi:RNA polymerase sigma-70 factor (ECF subfamily)